MSSCQYGLAPLILVCQMSCPTVVTLAVGEMTFVPLAFSRMRECLEEGERRLDALLAAAARVIVMVGREEGGRRNGVENVFFLVLNSTYVFYKVRITIKFLLS